MYQLLIYGCDNPYGDGDDKLLFQRASVNLAGLKEYIQQYQGALKEKHIVRMHCCLLEMNTEEGKVIVLDNFVAAVPPRTRTVINPAAAPAVKKKSSLKFIVPDAMIDGAAPTAFPG